MKTRNVISHESGELVARNAEGEVIFRRPYRTPAEALAEFKYACISWFACMDSEARAHALVFAQRAFHEVEFAPSCEPR